MKWHEEKNRIILQNVRDFDLKQTFECGQCFRWVMLESGSWLGVVGGLAAEVEMMGQDIILHNVSRLDFERVWYPYFDLGRDYGAVKQKLAQDDPVMARAIAFAPGLRLLKQEFFETLISFIISQNNNIPRIKRIVDCLSGNYGKPISYKDYKLYAFPDVKVLSSLSEESLHCIRAGYRSRYIIAASQRALEFDFDTLMGMDPAAARKELLQFMGVGEKVADCVRLFSGLALDAFPVDRWVRRVMGALYPGCGSNNQEIASFAQKKFGSLAGIAQQYLFYYARENHIGMD